MDISIYLILVFFPFLMAYAAFSDILSMTISNKISILLILGFAFFSWQLGMDWETLQTHLTIFAAVLAFGFAGFALNLFGGGDAKLLACTSLWLGSETAPYLLYSTFIGGLMSILLLQFRVKILPETLYSIKWVKRLHQDGFGMPYGVALAIGAIVVFPSTPWMEHIIQKAIG